MNRSNGTIRRDDCHNCDQGCAAFTAKNNTKICLCGHPALQHSPRYTDRFPGHQQKGGCDRTQCVGFGSSELQWNASTVCDGCSSTWLQHRFPPSPAKSNRNSRLIGSSSASGAIESQNPKQGAAPNSTEHEASDDEAPSIDSDANAIPEPYSQISPLDRFWGSRSPSVTSLTPKMSDTAAYSIAKKRRVVANGKDPTVTSLTRTKTTTFAPNVPRRKGNSFRVVDPKTKTIMVLLLPLEGSPKACAVQASPIRTLSLWVNKFLDAFERFRYFGLVLECVVPDGTHGYHLWSTIDQQFEQQTKKAGLQFQRPAEHITPHRFAPQAAAWTIMKVGRLTTKGYRIQSASQFLHWNNYTIPELIKISGPLNKTIKQRLSPVDRPDVLLLAAFMCGHPSGPIPTDIPHTPRFTGVHSSDCYRSHFLYNLEDDLDNSDTVLQCTCHREKGKKRAYVPVDSDDESQSSEAPRDSPQLYRSPEPEDVVDDAVSEADSIEIRPKKHMPSSLGRRRPPTKSTVVLRTPSLSPPPFDDDVENEMPSLWLGAQQRPTNPYRRSHLGAIPASSFRFPGTPTIVLGSSATRTRIPPSPPRPEFSSATGGMPGSSHLTTVQNSTIPPTSMTLPARGTTVGGSGSLAGYSQFPPQSVTRHDHHIPEQPLVPPTPAALSATVLSEPVDIDDETVRALTRELQALAHERDGSTVMELIGSDSLACANVLLDFFKEHARAHCAGDGLPNSAAWQIEGVEATIGPAGLLPIDTFNRVRLVRAQRGSGPGPTREIAALLMQQACKLPGVCRKSLLPALLNLNLTSLGGVSLSRRIHFMTLGLCAAWHIAVTGSAPLPLSSLEIIVALKGTISLLNEELVLVCAPTVHNEFFSIWNLPNVSPSLPIGASHPLGRLIGLRVGEDPVVFGDNRTQDQHDEIGAMLLARMTNGNPAGCYGDTPAHVDFTAFQAGLFVELGQHSLKTAWPTNTTAAANLVCAMTPLPLRDAGAVIERLVPRYSNSQPLREIQEEFVSSLKHYLLSSPSHPNSRLFSAFEQDEDYEAIQMDPTYRARCLLYQMTSLDVIPFGSSWELEINFTDNLVNEVAVQDVIRFSACDRAMNVPVTRALEQMIHAINDGPVHPFVQWLHSQIATEIVGPEAGRLRSKAPVNGYNVV